MATLLTCEMCPLVSVGQRGRGRGSGQGRGRGMLKNKKLKGKGWGGRGRGQGGDMGMEGGPQVRRASQLPNDIVCVNIFVVDDLTVLFFKPTKKDKIKQNTQPSLGSLTLFLKMCETARLNSYYTDELFIFLPSASTGRKEPFSEETPDHEQGIHQPTHSGAQRQIHLQVLPRGPMHQGL